MDPKREHALLVCVIKFKIQFMNGEVELNVDMRLSSLRLYFHLLNLWPRLHAQFLHSQSYSHLCVVSLCNDSWILHLMVHLRHE